MSGQLESNHFFRMGDAVRGMDGRTGKVGDAGSLFAIILWSDGEEAEVDQFDPRVIVIERAVRDP